ncbi:MAG TPA: 3-oxoacyl-[acyl-carrier-protein] reductase [Opitutales bacterium]|nr:3-oxoacyl-[acyl-carrier-protein] reductase [Opitutales bacterium]
MSSTSNERVAVVTGAGRGIGKAIAEVLAAGGIKVVCVSRSENNCGKVAEEILSNGGKAEALAVDVSDAAAVEEASAKLLEKHEVVDILVNNAGITRDGMMLRMTNENWDSVLNTNLSSCFYWTKGLGGKMARKRWGRIVNIGSVIGIMGNAGQVNYAAAKAGIIGFTKSMAKEFASRSVTCNVVAPGFIETDMTAELNEDVTKQILAQIPLKRFGKAEDIANMVDFLCSDKAGYITGQVFTVDGGMVM